MNNTVSEIKKFIVENVSKMNGIAVDKVQTSEPFENLGIDSISAVRIVGELEDYLDAELPSSLLWEYNNIDDLAEHLSTIE